MQLTDARDAAQLYIEMGFRVVPLYGVTAEGCECGTACKPRDWGKHCPPEYEERWKDGAGFGPEHFGASDNIALAMGPWGGSDDWLVALDCDGADASYWFGELPQTLTQKTPRGWHYVFAVPAYAPLGNWVDALATRASGHQLDLRYARGRIVAAPSRGYAGAYEWSRVQEPAPLSESALDALYDSRRARGLEVLDSWHRGGKRP